MAPATWSLSVILLLHLYRISPVDAKVDCEICENIVDNIQNGVRKTAKSNFGGGNTEWEEKKLGNFLFSETRLVEVLEYACTDSSKETDLDLGLMPPMDNYIDCHSMLEEHEETIEEWWFKIYAKRKNIALYDFLCIDKARVCCPSGTFGLTCAECPGGKERPCRDQGKCDGNGTREGTGRCKCSRGYEGSTCDECSKNFYEVERNETDVVCKSCHVACKDKCFGDGSSSCVFCKDGWEMVTDEGCKDIDECESLEKPCKSNEFCLNSEGSYSCQTCSKECLTCTGAGPEKCDVCAPKHYKEDEKTCKECHPGCLSWCSDGTALSCDDCATGYELTDDGCTDINECETEGICDGDEYCINKNGSHTCSTCHSACEMCTGPSNSDCKDCKSGYSRNEENMCKDIDECDDGACSGDGEKCVNMIGSHKCECKDGFIRKNDQCVAKPKAQKRKKYSAVGQGTCETCRSLVENIYAGVMKTDKQNFGGGNTRWEEKKLGSYEHSETRWIEVMDRVCSDTSECHHMLEQHEDYLERWWFDDFPKQQNMDLITTFCIRHVQVCCPNGTVGTNCRDCIGGREHWCRGNGKCDGEGTRQGSGQCKCDDAYQGWDCADCNDGYYEISKNDTHTECKACHPSCKTCYDDGKEACEDCKEGWMFLGGGSGCFDIDECKQNEDLCPKENQHCENTEGNYECVCDKEFKLNNDTKECEPKEQDEIEAEEKAKKEKEKEERRKMIQERNEEVEKMKANLKKNKKKSTKKKAKSVSVDDMVTMEGDVITEDNNNKQEL